MRIRDDELVGLSTWVTISQFLDDIDVIEISDVDTDDTLLD
jgi:hypothetical protein